MTLDNIDDFPTGTALVQFSASWCVPCKRMAPIVRKVGEDLKLETIQIDVEKFPELVERYNVASVPTILLMEQGSVTLTQRGLISAASFKTSVETALQDDPALD